MGNWIRDGFTVVWDENAPAADDGSEAFDPGEHTVADVKAWVTDHPDQVQAIYDAEVAGKARQTLLDWLTADGS